MLLGILGLLVSLSVLLVSLYISSKRWDRVLRDIGLSSTRGLDATRNPIAAAERGAEAERATQERRQALLAAAPSDSKAAKELQQLLSDEIRALEKVIGRIRRNEEVTEAITPDVFQEWDAELANLKRLKERVARFLPS